MNKDRFGEVFYRYHLVVAREAYTILQDYHYAQDVTQDVFWKLYDKMDDIEDTFLEQWLRTVARHRAIDYLRTAHYRYENWSLELVDESFWKTEFWEKYLWNKEYRRLEWDICEQMRKENPKGLELLCDVYVDRKSTIEIARQYGISENTARTRIHRAKAWIRCHYNERFLELKK